MAHATTWSAVVKSPVYQTASPVSVPVPVDFAKDATMPPAAVTSAISVGPNWVSTSVGLPNVSNQNITSGPPVLDPVQTSTGSPANVTDEALAPIGIVGQVPLTAGSIVGPAPADPLPLDPLAPLEVEDPPFDPELPPPELLVPELAPGAVPFEEPCAPPEPEPPFEVPPDPPLELLPLELCDPLELSLSPPSSEPDPPPPPLPPVPALAAHAATRHRPTPPSMKSGVLRTGPLQGCPRSRTHGRSPTEQ
jgi:hypothetical protein